LATQPVEKTFEDGDILPCNWCSSAMVLHGKYWEWTGSKVQGVEV
jgi:hypothetical protein